MKLIQVLGDGLVAVCSSIHTHDALGYRASAHHGRTKLGLFMNGYWQQIKADNTLGYRAKMELAHTAKAVSAGIDSLRS